MVEVYQIEVTSTIIVIIHQRRSRKLGCSFCKSQTRREIKGILNFISNEKTIRYISETVTNWDIIVIPYHRNHAQETSMFCACCCRNISLCFLYAIYNICMCFFVDLKSCHYGLYMPKLWVDNCELYVCL